MKLSVTVFLGLMLAMLAVSVSGKPKTYLIETVDDALVRDATKKFLAVRSLRGGGGPLRKINYFKNIFFPHRYLLLNYVVG